MRCLRTLLTLRHGCLSLHRHRKTLSKNTFFWSKSNKRWRKNVSFKSYVSHKRRKKKKFVTSYLLAFLHSLVKLLLAVSYLHWIERRKIKLNRIQRKRTTKSTLWKGFKKIFNSISICIIMKFFFSHKKQPFKSNSCLYLRLYYYKNVLL